MTQQFIQTDSRGRTTLPRKSVTFVITPQQDGALLLEPASMITDAEREFIANGPLQEQLRHDEAHPELRKPLRPRRTRRADGTA